MAFTAIEPAAGLTRAERRHVAEFGPPAVLLRTSYPSLLDSAGFVDVVVDDVTADYRSTIVAWLDQTRRHADAVAALVGPDELDQRQERRTNALGAIDAGWLRRRLYVARRRGQDR